MIMYFIENIFVFSKSGTKVLLFFHTRKQKTKKMHFFTQMLPEEEEEYP